MIIQEDIEGDKVKMRLDKFLKMSKVIKRRTVANEVADNRKSSRKWKNCKTKL